MNNKILYLLIVSFFLLTNSNLLAQSQNISILSIENSDKSVDLFYEKKNPGSYTLNIEFSNLSNCNVSTYEKVICDNSGFIMKLEPVDKNQNITYSIQYIATLGAVNPKIDNLFKYVLPFKNGKKIKIFEAEYAGQKYFGLERFPDWKSYAVATNKPDTICSMRKGIVVLIDNQYNDNSVLDAQFTSRRNQVVIEHEDGTFAMYKGFKKDGIFVQLGQTVNAQTELGIIEKYNKKEYRLDFDVYYLSQNLNSQIEQSPLRAKNTYQYFPPVFYTQEGRKRLESGKEYTVFQNENI
ncbi:hypothetical protein SD960_01110 [Flavobacterium sp. MMLR14_040]|uniref:hypothetical protein n=1 Tax=Flavobacterium sp. MMLR14_040 TaxID=3093843 RepID=UPI00298F8933|nr:hypothetical protein [Flavobacterium sp. MMLR14_040]MDW8848672.1 hypothetical protein [Flavobacterium sp. MMLR14_040]